MIRVFISYSHDDATHCSSVRNLADRLIRDEGLDVELDQYHESSPPPEGWELWTEKKVRDSDFTILICTTEYCAAFDDEKPRGTRRGVRAEAQIMRQILFNDNQHNKRYIAVLINDSSEDCIPLRLRSHSHYQLYEQYDSLVRQLTGQPRIIKPDRGKGRHLPPENSTAHIAIPVPETPKPSISPQSKPWLRRAIAASLFVSISLTAVWQYFLFQELQAAQAEYDHGNLVGAREVLEAHPQRWENNAAAQFLLGVIAMRQDENQRALMYYERAARLDSSAPQYRGNLATTKLRIDDSPKSRKEAQKVFADILDGSQPFMLAAVEWLRLELLRDRGPDWAAINSRIAIGDNWMNEAAMNQPWNRLFWRFPDQTGEMQRLIYDNDNPVKRDDRQCYWYHLKLLTMYLHKTGPLPTWHDQCLVSQPARIVLAADILRIKLAHPEWQTRLHEAAAEMGLPGSTDI